ncbi:MAG: NAD-dependent epimerase/dehydratase family protein [Candidatus Pacearchaeota archaeon]
MVKNILITGGAGFVGSNLAIFLKDNNPKLNIICFDNLKRRGSELNLKRLKKEGINFIHGDIRNEHDFDEINEFDLMIECSAEPSVMSGINSSPKYLLDTNLVGTINCLELARKRNSKIIFLSTSRVYSIEKINSLNFIETETRFEFEETQKIAGVSFKGISERFALDGYRSLYGASKLASELIMEEYNKIFGLKTIINRCGVIAGPWQMGKTDQGIIPFWLASHILKKEISYIGYGGKGKQVRDFIHIDDLCELILYQIDNFEKFNGKLFNVGGGKENSFSLQELTKTCQKITGNVINIDSINEERPMDIKWFITDISKIRSFIPDWCPKKKLDETVKEIYDWLKENRNVLSNIFR